MSPSTRRRRLAVLAAVTGLPAVVWAACVFPWVDNFPAAAGRRGQPADVRPAPEQAGPTPGDDRIEHMWDAERIFDGRR
jgi:hypothetical protein